MTATQDDNEITQEVMAVSLTLAQSTPDMMDESIIQLEQKLTLLYEDAYARGDTAAMDTINASWDVIQSIRSLVISQALGVASAGIMATGMKMQRDEALIALGHATEACKQLSILAGVPHE